MEMNSWAEYMYKNGLATSHFQAYSQNRVYYMYDISQSL